MGARDIKPYHERPAHLKHDFPNEFTHTVWSVALNLSDDYVAAVPLYTLSNRRLVRGTGATPGAWAWEYRGWITEERAQDSFSPHTGDWEKLTRRELTHGIRAGTQPPTYV